MASDAQNAIPAQFPHDDVLKALDDWWEHEKADAVLPGAETVPDIMKPSVEIDSTARSARSSPSRRWSSSRFLRARSRRRLRRP